MDVQIRPKVCLALGRGHRTLYSDTHLEIFHSSEAVLQELGVPQEIRFSSCEYPSPDSELAELTRGPQPSKDQQYLSYRTSRLTERCDACVIRINHQPGRISVPGEHSTFFRSSGSKAPFPGELGSSFYLHAV